jgi:hypothetical protein
LFNLRYKARKIKIKLNNHNFNIQRVSKIKFLHFILLNFLIAEETKDDLEDKVILDGAESLTIASFASSSEIGLGLLICPKEAYIRGKITKPMGT